MTAEHRPGISTPEFDPQRHDPFDYLSDLSAEDKKVMRVGEDSQVTLQKQPHPLDGPETPVVIITYGGIDDEDPPERYWFSKSEMLLEDWDLAKPRLVPDYPLATSHDNETIPAGEERMSLHNARLTAIASAVSGVIAPR